MIAAPSNYKTEYWAQTVRTTVSCFPILKPKTGHKQLEQLFPVFLFFNDLQKWNSNKHPLYALLPD